MDFWLEVDIWFGYGEVIGDDLIIWLDSSNVFNGVVNGNLGNLVVDRVIFIYYVSLDLVIVISSLVIFMIVKILVIFSIS